MGRIARATCTTSTLVLEGGVDVRHGLTIAVTGDDECGMVPRTESKAAPRSLSMLLPAAVRARQTAVSIP